MNPQQPTSFLGSLITNLNGKNIRSMMNSNVSPSTIHWFGMSFVVVVLLWLITYITTKINLGNTNCGAIKYSFEQVNKTTPTKISSSWISQVSPDKDLRDFYIKTAYNCCASGQFKNDYVGTCALYNAIAQGVRCLDFEIYCLNDAPVVAVSSIDMLGVKQSYNTLPASRVLKIISQYAFSQSQMPEFVKGSANSKPVMCPNPNDPLLLHFRLKTNKINVLNQLASEIVQNLGDKLLPIEYMREYNGKNLTSVSIKEFIGKVIIMVEKGSATQGMPILYQCKNLWELTNVTTNSAFIYEKRFSDIRNTNDPKDITDFNRQNMTLVLPDVSEHSMNYISSIPQVLGCQLMAMNFQTLDTNLTAYNAIFEKAGSAFAPKPDELLYTPTYIENPKPLDPKFSYATRSMTVAGGLVHNY
jgi:hypothetical protein